MKLHGGVCEVLAAVLLVGLWTQLCDTARQEEGGKALDTRGRYARANKWEDGIDLMCSSCAWAVQRRSPPTCWGMGVVGHGPVRLRGGVGHHHPKIEADKFYKKRKQVMEEGKAQQREGGDELDSSEDDDGENVAKEVRGLPLKDRLKVALEGKDPADLQEAMRRKEEAKMRQKRAKTPDGKDRKKVGLGDQSSSKVAAGEGAGGGSLIVKRGLDQQDVSVDSDAAQGSGDVDAVEDEPICGMDGEMNFGFAEPMAGKHRLRTSPCTGDAWAGIFMDIQAKSTSSVLIKALCFGSANFRLEPSINVKIWTTPGPSAGKEGNAAAWKLVFLSPNCTVGKVKRLEQHPDKESPYSQFPFLEPIRVPAGQTVSFVIYTNSLCGMAIRCNSDALPRNMSSQEKDSMGMPIGDEASVPIVKSAQDARRWEKTPIKHGEMTDQDSNLRILAGYCTPVTGKDHPFDEELLERWPDNVFAFVGEVVYDLEAEEDAPVA